MTEEDITAKLKLKEYLTTNEQVLTYEKNFYLTNKRLIKFIMKTDIPKIEAFQDMDLNHLVSIQKMYKNYKYLRYFGAAVLVLGILWFFFMPVSMTDLLLLAIPLILVGTGIACIFAGFYSKENISFISSAHTRMVAGELSEKFLANIREVIYYKPKKTVKRRRL